ncbi:CHAT domain-containing protein [Nostoc sp.]|uniref:CHAT domain-containing protein n=1 Tax=Nostoc sp. TaxID=1180 RepID=UPI002FF0D30D
MNNPQKKPNSLQDILQQRQSGFVGREEQVSLFRQNLDLSLEDSRRHFLFNVWGQGGVGKSTLLRQFRKMAESVKMITAYTDESEKSIPEVMGRLAEELERQGHKLTQFTERYKLYRQKRQELETDPEAPQGFSAFVGKTVRLAHRVPVGGAVFDFVDEDALATQAREWASYVAKKITNKDEDALATQAREWASYVAKKITNKDEVRLVQEPVEILTPLFLQDIFKIAKETAVVLFFDTYERTGEFLDNWLREILEGRYGEVSLNILITIAGRQELDKNHWTPYEALIVRFPLEPFTEEEAQQYLTRKGITNSRVIEVILRLSGNLPLLVGMLADAHPNDPNQVVQPSSSAVEHFLKWIDDPKRRQLAIDAAIPRSLNRDVLAKLRGEDEADELFSWLKEMPSQRITTQPRPVPQPDFILRIQKIWNETNSTCKFQYQLKSFRFPSIFPDNNIYTSDSLSTSWIEQVRGLLATTLENISSSLPTEGKSRLSSLGQYLFKHLFPTELQSDFRFLISQNSTFTLLILADQEAWIPWELLYDGQKFLGDRFIISRWLQELNDTRPYEFPVGTVNVAHYANVEQPQLWATLLEAPGAPPPQPLPAGVLHDSTEAIRGLHLIRYSQSSDADLRNAPVTLDNINDTEDIELQMRPAKLNLRRNRPFVTLSYIKTDAPELTALENTWASAFIRAGCSGFIGSLWAVEPAVEAAFISCFYNRLWAGASLGEAFYTSRQLARVAAPDSLDWLAYVLFGDPMARPYRPVPGDGYAIVEPIGREIDDPLPPGAIARFRVTLRRNPPVWHEDRVIEVAENLVFENLQVHIVTYGLQVIPDLPITMTLTAKGDYLGWFTLVVPNEITDTSALVQVYFADGMRPIHSLNFSLKIENGREE